jgi:hypothetical protein
LERAELKATLSSNTKMANKQEIKKFHSLDKCSLKELFLLHVWLMDRYLSLEAITKSRDAWSNAKKW